MFSRIFPFVLSEPGLAFVAGSTAAMMLSDFQDQSIQSGMASTWFSLSPRMLSLGTQPSGCEEAQSSPAEVTWRGSFPDVNQHQPPNTQEDKPSNDLSPEPLSQPAEAITEQG